MIPYFQAQTEALLAMQQVQGNAPAGFSKTAAAPPPQFGVPPPINNGGPSVPFSHPPPFHQPPPFGGPPPHHQGPPHPPPQDGWGNNGYNSRNNGGNHFNSRGGSNRGYGTGDNRRGNW